MKESLAMGVVDIGDSRLALLEEIGDGHDVTLARGPGNLGDELIAAGVRSLLSGRMYREVDVSTLGAASGDVLLLCAAGAWCRPFHEWAPRALAIAEMRFRRVIVLPATFDVREDSVRAALERSSATVFAREHVSFRHISGICDARLAHDCAFFFDYSPYVTEGSGVLNAFRTDPEAPPGAVTAPANDDIAVTADSLESFLRTIAAHELIRTDRAHVMIPAALTGKRVEFAPSSYFKIDALADSWLSGRDMIRIDAPRAPAHVASPVTRAEPPLGEPRVTVAILTHDRREAVASAVGSALRSGVPVRVLLLGNNPDEATRTVLEGLAAQEERIELRVLDRNLGCGGGRRLACELADTEFVLFLDDDAELSDGALERLVSELDEHPDAVGATALVVGSDGIVQHCGGTVERFDDTVVFKLSGSRRRLDVGELPPAGSSDWLPGTAALIRTATLRSIPIDPGPTVYYEDNEWSFRVRQSVADPFRRCPDALVLHDARDGRQLHTCELARVSWLAERLAAMARFFDRHGLILDVDLVHLVPELALDDGSVDLPAARLLLELVLANGTDWLVAEWTGGGLEPLLGRRSRRADVARERERLDQVTVEREQLAAERERLAAELDQQLGLRDWLMERHRTLENVERGGWWRLRARLLPAIRLAGAARETARSVIGR